VSSSSGSYQHQIFANKGEEGESVGRRRTTVKIYVVSMPYPRSHIKGK
jgi:hypothetical protein